MNFLFLLGRALALLLTLLSTSLLAAALLACALTLAMPASTAGCKSGRFTNVMFILLSFCFSSSIVEPETALFPDARERYQSFRPDRKTLHHPVPS